MSGASATRRPKLCLVAAAPITVSAFMTAHLDVLGRRYAVTVVTSTVTPLLRERHGTSVTFAPVPIARPIAPLTDLPALLALWRLFRRERFDLVQSVTPKAGMLPMVAARLARVPVRMHWFTGQVWATRRGAGRWILRQADRVLAASATHLLADSASQRSFLIAEQVADPAKVTVLAQGSISGVDAARFRPDEQRRRTIREHQGIPDAAVVAVYVWRLSLDKGLVTIARAFAAIAVECPDLWLLIVGPDEDGLRPGLERLLSACLDRVRFVPYTDAPENYLAAGDFLVLASRREGFGSTVVEAAACGLPAAASNIYGLRDAVVDGESGILVPVDDTDAVAAAMRRLAQEHGARHAMGERARLRALRDFSQAELTSALAAYYARALAHDPPAR